MLLEHGGEHLRLHGEHHDAGLLGEHLGGRREGAHAGLLRQRRELAGVVVAHEHLLAGQGAGLYEAAGDGAAHGPGADDGNGLAPEQVLLGIGHVSPFRQRGGRAAATRLLRMV